MKNKAYYNIVAIFLLVLFAGMAVSSIWPDRKSPTCDELAHHVPVGYVLLDKFDIKMDTSHPPLSRYIIALPLKLFMRLNMPDDASEWRRENRYEFGRDFFYKYNDDPERIILLSRLAIVVIGIICGIVLYLWASSAYGVKVGLFTLLFYCFSPNILAHSRLATTDMVATCFMLLSLATFWYFMRTPSGAWIVAAGVALGLAQLSKYTLLLMYPIFLVLLVFEMRSPDEGLNKKDLLRGTALIFLISIFVLWAGYGFDVSPLLSGAMRVDEKVGIINHIILRVLPGAGEGVLGYVDNAMLHMPMPLGAHILGIMGVINHGYVGHGTFFLGKWSGQGTPLYFLLAFFIKTPIPLIISFFMGMLASIKKGFKKNDLYIFGCIFIFFLTASLSNLQLGLRYILPIYPLVFIIASRGLDSISSKRVVVSILLGWYVLSSLLIWPNYLSYFNEFIGGPRNGYKYLRDSNIDWGQDLPALSSYMSRNDIEKVRLFYFGTADPSQYNIQYDNLSVEEMKVPLNEVYAISLHRIDAVEWAQNNEPKAVIGGSIFIYDFREK